MSEIELFAAFQMQGAGLRLRRVILSQTGGRLVMRMPGARLRDAGLRNWHGFPGRYLQLQELAGTPLGTNCAMPKEITFHIGGRHANASERHLFTARLICYCFQSYCPSGEWQAMGLMTGVASQNRGL
jgi:hypothetical protein